VPSAKGRDLHVTAINTVSEVMVCNGEMRNFLKQALSYNACIYFEELSKTA